jgi:hypothetical protein
MFLPMFFKFRSAPPTSKLPSSHSGLQWAPRQDSGVYGSPGSPSPQAPPPSDHSEARSPSPSSQAQSAATSATPSINRPTSSTDSTSSPSPTPNPSPSPQPSTQTSSSPILPRAPSRISHLSTSLWVSSPAKSAPTAPVDWWPMETGVSLAAPWEHTPSATRTEELPAGLAHPSLA